MVRVTEIQASNIRHIWVNKKSRKDRFEFDPSGIRSPGSALLSHKVTLAVPSAHEGLTTLFGMRRGVAPPLSPPEEGGSTITKEARDRTNFH